jgi:hypothetical protein
MIARNSDAVNWSAPKMIIGSAPGTKDRQASWAFPVVSRQGRIYLFYTKQVELDDGNPQGCGTMGVLYSDDEGRSWTTAQDISMPRNEYDHPNPDVPKHWIVWQMPIRDRKGRYVVGYTQCTSKSRYDAAGVGWYGWSSRCQFMRFENLDEGPDRYRQTKRQKDEGEDGGDAQDDPIKTADIHGCAVDVVPLCGGSGEAAKHRPHPH